MKYYFFLLLIPLFYACSSEEKIESPFIIQEIKISLNDTLSDCYKVNDGYICETNHRKLIFLNNNFKIDTLLTKKIQPTFDLAYLDSKNDTIFGIEFGYIPIYYFLNDDFNWLPIEDYYYSMHEDEKYIVSDCCIGEYGGSIFFKEKSTQKVFSCPATCAVGLNKIDGIYYLTNSIAHLNGFSEILKIENPKNLFELTIDSLKNNCNWWVRHPLYSTDKTAFQKGTETIFESNDLILTSFVKNETFYHINSTEDKTFISTLENNQLNPVDSFSKSLFAYFSNLESTKDGFIYNFNNNEFRGFIELETDTMRLLLF